RLVPGMERLLAILLLVACTAPQPPPGSAGPAEAVQDFAAALQKGDAATAWSLLSSRTQKEADAAAARARAFAGDAGPAQGRAMLFASALPGRPGEAGVPALVQSPRSGPVGTIASPVDGFNILVPRRELERARVLLTERKQALEADPDGAARAAEEEEAEGESSVQPKSNSR